MAERFLQKLKEKNLPGVQEIAALVEQLIEEYNMASWNTRILFPHLGKERCLRINLGYFKKTSSPLRQELLPEDVPEPPNITPADDQDYVYDWNYVASTDPIHPVDTNYAHPLDGVDPCWMLNHLTPEEFAESSGDVGFDISEAETMWADNTASIYSTTDNWREASDATVKDPTKHDLPGDSAVEAPLFPPAAQTESSEIGELRAKHIEMVVREFWKVVNDEDPSGILSPSCSSNDLTIQLNNIHVSDSSGTSNELYAGLLTPPATPPQPPTYGSCDQPYHEDPPSTDERRPPLLSPASHPTTTSRTTLIHSPSTANPPSSNATRSSYYQDVLALSRCEIKDVEGPSGRFVPDPPMPRDGHAGNACLR
ncbi:hypothetical protein EKO04_010389 [Ascochyta lentis]|uniref:Uncharacterized protein n=1 Tax=Ascochyta lentis TaxID=205686 RepID=A0A8H7IVD3_9PLEO|nr:hypothetical protein EKO04_010389 [Ascochyta lentis]